jgi:hypothetical protein
MTQNSLDRRIINAYSKPIMIQRNHRRALGVTAGLSGHTPQVIEGYGFKVSEAQLERAFRHAQHRMLRVAARIVWPWSSVQFWGSQTKTLGLLIFGTSKQLCMLKIATATAHSTHKLSNASAPNHDRTFEQR